MSDDKDNLDIATQLVHASERKPPPTGQPTATPIYASATYTYESMEEIDKVFGGELPGYIYTRYGNPTVTALETAIQVIEAGATACAYSSGMAALHASLISCELSSGATVLASQDLYGATTNLLQTIFGSFGIKTVTVDRNRARSWRASNHRQHFCLAISLSAFEAWRGFRRAQRDKISERSCGRDGRHSGLV